jgi:hypothetical protein
VRVTNLKHLPRVGKQRSQRQRGWRPKNKLFCAVKNLCGLMWTPPCQQQKLC